MSALANSPEHDAFPSGTIVGNKYRIDGVLGSGGMGVVLSAMHLELDAPVAIKVVRGELAQNAELASQLLFEARAVARMSSVHVVRILDVARLPSGAPYIVMEQLRGTDLASLIEKGGPLSMLDAVAYLRQACEGLSEAHALGIVHRDLKPENLFLARTPEGAVLKILDFGISKYIGGVGGSLRRAPRSTLTRAGRAVGSPFYMSPEQMRAAPDLDGRADIWSLGAILFELLTARCPFEADTPAALCAKVMADEAPSLQAFSEGLPPELDAIVHRCLAKDPNARYQSVAELAEALRNFALSAATAPTRHVSGIDLRVEPPPSSRGTHLALAGVCLMLALAGVTFWQLQGRSAAHPTLTASTLATEVMPNRPAPPLPTAAPEPTTAHPRHVVPAVAARPSAPAPTAAEPPATTETTEAEDATAASSAVSTRQETTRPSRPSAPRATGGWRRPVSDPAARYGL